MSPFPKPLVVVIGVSGSGKSTVGELLARRLGVPYADADELHPQANVDKMAAGHPLNDEDRWPWLAKVGAALLGTGTVLTYAVRAANAFRMPVSAKALEVYAGISAQEVLARRADYCIADGSTRLYRLGDILYLPVPGIGGFASVGDIFIAAGICFLVIAVMGKKEPEPTVPEEAGK